MLFVCKCCSFPYITEREKLFDQLKVSYYSVYSLKPIIALPHRIHLHLERSLATKTSSSIRATLWRRNMEAIGDLQPAMPMYGISEPQAP